MDLSQSDSASEISGSTGSSPKQRKTYEKVPRCIQNLPEYVNKRERNKNAVIKCRERLKTKAKLLKTGKVHFTYLKELYDKELTRIEKAKQQLEKLIYQCSSSKTGSNEFRELIRAEKEARSIFEAKLAAQESQVEDVELSVLGNCVIDLIGQNIPKNMNADE